MHALHYACMLCPSDRPIANHQLMRHARLADDATPYSHVPVRRVGAFYSVPYKGDPTMHPLLITFLAHSSLPTSHIPHPTAHCLLPTTHGCSLPTSPCPPPTAYYPRRMAAHCPSSPKGGHSRHADNELPVHLLWYLRAD